MTDSLIIQVKENSGNILWTPLNKEFFLFSFQNKGISAEVLTPIEIDWISSLALARFCRRKCSFDLFRAKIGPISFRRCASIWEVTKEGGVDQKRIGRHCCKSIIGAACLVEKQSYDLLLLLVGRRRRFGRAPALGGATGRRALLLARLLLLVLAALRADHGAAAEIPSSVDSIKNVKNRTKNSTTTMGENSNTSEKKTYVFGNVPFLVNYSIFIRNYTFLSEDSIKEIVDGHCDKQNWKLVCVFASKFHGLGFRAKKTWILIQIN